MTDFTHKNLSGARFEDVYLTGADFHGVDLTGARFRLVDLTGVTIRGADLVDMDISGQIKNLKINGVDVAPLVEAELDRRYPGRAKMRPSDAAGYREARSHGGYVQNLRIGRLATRQLGARFLSTNFRKLNELSRLFTH